MITEEMNKGIKDLKNISLTKAEKKLILDNLTQMPISSPYAPVPSLWNFTRSKFAYVTASLLIILMTGGTLAYADEFSLPGDLLYSIKRHITEPVRDVLSVTPTSRAEWEAEKAIRRLSEAEALALKNNLTPERRDEIEKDFNKNVAAFHENVRAIATSTHESEDLDASFEKSIKSHSDTLKAISSDKNDGEQHEVDTLNETILKASRHKADETDINKKEQSANKSSSSEQEIKRPDENSKDGIGD